MRAKRLKTFFTLTAELCKCYLATLSSYKIKTKSTFFDCSMWPLLLKDGLSLPYVSCMLLFFAVGYHVFDLRSTKPLKQALVNMLY